jgi:hypothetical protein
VELYYFDGEQCAGGVARDVRVQFFCDPDAGAGKPLDYYVLEEDCHYSITWPSKYGCPAAAGTFVGGLTGWGVVGWFFLIATAYVGGGCAYNVLRRGASPGPEALPHPEFWRELPGLVADGVQVPARAAACPGRFVRCRREGRAEGTLGGASESCGEITMIVRVGGGSTRGDCVRRRNGWSL